MHGLTLIQAYGDMLTLWLHHFVSRLVIGEGSANILSICCNKGCLRALLRGNLHYIQETRAELRGEDTYEHGISEGSGHRATEGTTVHMYFIDSRAATGY